MAVRPKWLHFLFEQNTIKVGCSKLSGKTRGKIWCSKMFLTFFNKLAAPDLKGLNKKERDGCWSCSDVLCAILLSMFLVVGWKTGQSDRCNLDGIIDEWEQREQRWNLVWVQVWHLSVNTTPPQANTHYWYLCNQNQDKNVKYKYKKTDRLIFSSSNF